MEKEITPEIKAKVFAQYAGQNVFKHYDQPVCVRWNFANFQIEGWKLILKPLSSITDEDAIEVYKMTQGRILKDGIENYSIDRKPEPIGIISIASFETPDEYLNIKIEGSTLQRWFYDGKKQAETQYCIQGYLSAYQYLQSRGYDLPNYILGGKTLFESGLCIYSQSEGTK